MKILGVRPGRVVPKAEGFSYTWQEKRPDGWGMRESPGTFASAAVAKQAMREMVAQEKKRHAV